MINDLQRGIKESYKRTHHLIGRPLPYCRITEINATEVVVIAIMFSFELFKS